tara:strand:+ start:2581 stop:3456 length:876 start_codon:yes stop_codon:yes gene_type:complete
MALGQTCSSSTPNIAETAAADGRFNTLVAAVGAADLAETLSGPGPFTVFAPTDAAFAKLPAGTVETLLKPENKEMLKSVLLYHVVPGNMPAKTVLGTPALVTANGQRLDVKMSNNGPMIDNANIILTDINTSNGTIHAIDTVVLPESMTIPQIAQKAGKFNTLLAAAKAAGLVDALSAKGPITVFAPTDEAFSKLPAGTIEMLLKPENKDQLAAILTYHVVPGRVYSNDALKAGSAKTLQGATARIRGDKQVVKVNDAKVIMADLDTSNGVIHVIDAVMLPPKATASAGNL